MPQAYFQFPAPKKVTLKELQPLCGLLNFACSVVTPGRAFLRRLIDLTIGLRSEHHKIRLTQQVKAALHVCHSFLENFNGQCISRTIYGTIQIS